MMILGIGYHHYAKKAIVDVLGKMFTEVPTVLPVVTGYIGHIHVRGGRKDTLIHT